MALMVIYFIISFVVEHYICLFVDLNKKITLFFQFMFQMNLSNILLQLRNLRCFDIFLFDNNCLLSEKSSKVNKLSFIFNYSHQVNIVNRLKDSKMMSCL